VLTAKEASALRDLLDKLLLSVRQIEDSPARRKPR